MCNDRGYPPIENYNATRKVCTNGDGDTITVIQYFDQNKVSVEEIRQFANSLQKEQITHGIIIMLNPPSPPVQAFLLSTNEDNTTRIEVFSSDELSCNKTKHVLTGKHIKLSQADAKIIKKRYGAAKLPQIKINDPIAKYYGAQKGDIFFIKRRVGVTYRIVTTV